ncbi:uncharacterized protein LOC135481881 isoform X2 [Liolophura sinensis]|uniref:uncharacterized protein LOC135481881 isoform X2 n=1 Tax=Liolophura sinensis TaxID=3198878 RepID=UPI0031585D45
MGNSCGCARTERKTKEGRSPKIRKKSKAHSAGVQEGDVVVSVNGKSVEGQSHMATMDMVDNSGESLVLGIKRGGQAQSSKGESEQAPPVTITPQPAGGPTSGSESVTVNTATVSVQQNGEGHTGTYSETLLGREAKHVKEERKVEEVRIEEQKTNSDEGRTIPIKVVPVATLPESTIAISSAPAPVVPTSTNHVPTTGASLIDDALSKLETFPKVTDAFTTCSESFEQASIANQQVTSNFPTETVTAELKEDFKENIAPVQFNTYSSAPPAVPSFNVKQLDVNKSVWQPASSSLGARPQQSRGPSFMEMQRSKFQKPAPPPPKPKPKPSRARGPVGSPQPFQPLQPVHHSQNVQQSPNFLQPDVSPKHHRKAPPVFGPPVTISIGNQGEMGDSDMSSPDSSIIRKKKLFSDSAFYDDPNAVYPTIDEQMKLCKSIALSLTSDANKRARGARMFAKRQKRAPKWIHEGHMDMSSSGGDVGNIDDLDSELSCDEGGTKPLFTFKIPKVATQKNEPGKMSLTQDEFERLRLDKHRCEHKTVSPNTCFNLVADLTSAKGRGAKIFEKRRAKAEEWVVDDSHIPKTVKPSPVSPGGRLADMLNSPPKPAKSPWEAALENPYGSVDAAFQHLSEYERMQLMNRNPPMPAMEPVPVPMHSKLPPGEAAALLQGPNFNRTAKGWMKPTGDGTPLEDLGIDYSRLIKNPPTSGAQPGGRQQMQYRDYNPKPKAWKAQESAPQHRSQQQQYSHNTSSSMSYGNHGGRWPATQASNSYSGFSQQSYGMGQPQYGYHPQQQQQQQQHHMYGTDL